MVDIVTQARELAATGTGRVTVGSTSSIEFQQLVRSVKAELDEETRDAISAAVTEAQAALNQVQRARDDVHPESGKKGLWKALTGIGAGLGKQAQERQRHKEMLRQSGSGPAAVPVAPVVVTALEAAAIATSDIELDDATREALATPWAQRHLTS